MTENITMTIPLTGDGIPTVEGSKAVGARTRHRIEDDGKVLAIDIEFLPIGDDANSAGKLEATFRLHRAQPILGTEANPADETAYMSTMVEAAQTLIGENLVDIVSEALSDMMGDEEKDLASITTKILAIASLLLAATGGDKDKAKAKVDEDHVAKFAREANMTDEQFADAKDLIKTAIDKVACASSHDGHPCGVCDGPDPDPSL